MSCTRHKFAVLVCGVLALAVGLSVRADDKKDDKDQSAASGTWVRKEGELKIEFDGKSAMKIHPHGDNKKIALVLEYTVEESKRIKVKLTGFEGEEKIVDAIKEKIAVGVEFSFKWMVKDDTAKLDDLKGKGDAIEHLKNHLEGDYEKK